MLQAILLDRDGVINVERADYVKSWDELCLLPGVLPALHALAAWRVPICVLTNQSAIGRGIVTAAAVDSIHRRLAALVAAHGGRIDAFFVCPHHPDAGCTCRKPQPGLLLQAAQQFDLDLTQCVLIGDAVTDFGAASAVRCPCILIESGRQGPQLRHLLGKTGPPIVPDLSGAVALLCEWEAGQSDANEVHADQRQHA